MNHKELEVLIDRFLGWPLPDSVRPDGMYPAGEYRKEYGVPLTGTNLLTLPEAKEMLMYVLRIQVLHD